MPVKKVNSSDFLKFRKDSYILERVNYYCKDQNVYLISNEATQVAKFKKTKSFAYYADTKKVVRYFSKSFKFDYLFGDIIHVPEFPSFLKSRPISDINQNSILLKLNAIRHYQFLNDKVLFFNKKSMAVWRGYIYQEQRELLVREFAEHPYIDVGHCDTKRLNPKAKRRTKNTPKKRKKYGDKLIRMKR